MKTSREYKCKYRLWKLENVKEKLIGGFETAKQKDSNQY